MYINIIMFVDEKKIESYFSDRLTLSNICSRTSRQIYRLALLLCAPEMFSSLINSRISIFNVHLTLFVRRMTSHNYIGKYHHLHYCYSALHTKLPKRLIFFNYIYLLIGLLDYANFFPSYSTTTKESGKSFCIS